MFYPRYFILYIIAFFDKLLIKNNLLIILNMANDGNTEIYTMKQPLLKFAGKLNKKDAENMLKTIKSSKHNSCHDILI